MNHELSLAASGRINDAIAHLGAAPNDYQIEPLARDDILVLARYRHPDNADALLVASAIAPEVEIQAGIQMEHEFALRAHLCGHWAVAPVALTRIQGRQVLVYDSFDFSFPQPPHRPPPGDILSFLTLALSICAALKRMHDQGLFHGNLKPTSLFIQPDGGCKLGGFGLAGYQSAARRCANVSVNGATPAYMSPEHTGRTPHGVDLRSDLYSLGVVFYELLTGHLPFAIDAGGGLPEWIHQHIACAPRRANLERPEIPDMLSRILLKLMAKSQQERYQTVAGVDADLKRCLASWGKRHRVADFVPGLRDTPPNLAFSRELSTGAADIGRILAVFEEVQAGNVPALVTIGGPPGIGKSTLLAAALAALQRKRACFAVGKIDPYRRELPFAALSEAFRSLILHVLGLPETQVNEWRRRIASSLAAYAGLAINLVPELALLMDKKNPFFDIPAVDAEARFNQSILHLVNVFATPDRPLVLFIDDAHWVDPASMRLLTYLMSHAAGLPLLMVIAYREPRFSSDGPFGSSLAILKNGSARVANIIPAPLDRQTLRQWLAQAFGSRPAMMGRLADAIHRHSGGNPGLVRQIIQRIVANGLLTRGKRKGQWHYHLHAIEQVMASVSLAGRDLAVADRRAGSVQPMGGNRLVKAHKATTRLDEIRDLESVIRAARALSEEINLDRLIHTLMMMTLEHAGAQRGLLIRLVDHAPVIEASADTTPTGVVVRLMNASPTESDLPLSVLTAVMRTGQGIRLGTPGEFNPFSKDAYLIASGAAAMCMPMFKQSRLVGVLYLENRLMPDAFTAEHSRVIGLLVAQAAVSLETATLYAELVEENLQRRRVEKELRASQASLMLGEKISHTGSWRWELAHKKIEISAEYARIVGLGSSAMVIPVDDYLHFIHPDDRQRVTSIIDEAVRYGRPLHAEYRIVRTDATFRYVSEVGEPVFSAEGIAEYFGTVTDITARKEAEDAVKAAQADLARVTRATTIGQLTASIAHEINQPLMSIVSNAGASLRWLNRDAPQWDNVRLGLEDIVAEGRRAGKIIHSLQALTRNDAPTFRRIDLHHITHHIIMLSRSELERRGIVVEYRLDAREPRVHGDSVQIQQVLLNLVINAMDAMAEVGQRPRVLTLTSNNPEPDTVVLGVWDTGIGILPTLIGQLFEPFYTTKPQGMGMGLAISHTIIESHRGKIAAARREPCGSHFCFSLPTFPEQAP